MCAQHRCFCIPCIALEKLLHSFLDCSARLRSIKTGSQVKIFSRFKWMLLQLTLFYSSPLCFIYTLSQFGYFTFHTPWREGRHVIVPPRCMCVSKLSPSLFLLLSAVGYFHIFPDKILDFVFFKRAFLSANKTLNWDKQTEIGKMCTFKFLWDKMCKKKEKCFKRANNGNVLEEQKPSNLI